MALTIIMLTMMMTATATTTKPWDSDERKTATTKRYVCPARDRELCV